MENNEDFKDIKKIKKALKLFWNKHRELNLELIEKEQELSKKMNLKIKGLFEGIPELEFFYVDGQCVGVGAKDYSKREFFPLIQDSDLN